ncbi:hypothetical protein OS493_031720 [Desmophyllum pertusum]|uniref:LAMB1/2/3/4 helical domain-containing protein n=1 Tax=Desmophyllum pertusum TaxID=174260 RepID=A0A9W9ZMU6_9CNID|nr:hypothetical protein OS493_031720 [Desmophyllum pertusum]
MAKKQRNITEQLIAGPPSFSEKHNKNTESFFDISEILEELLEEVDVLNGIVCGTPSSQCGGCGVLNCSTCGGPGCNGSMDLAGEALERAREAEEAQRTREAKAKDMLEEVQNAEMMMNMTRDAADRAMMRAMDAVQRARNSSNRMDQLIQDILKFLSQDFGNTDQVRELVNTVKQLKLSVTPEEIAKLAEDIKKALESLTGIDDILDETEERLNTANNLKERAEMPDVLAKAAGSQAAAKVAIDATEDDIKMAEDILNQLLADLDALEAAVDTAQSNVTDMASMVPMVKEQFEKNQEQLNIAEKNAMDAHNQSQQAQQEADELMGLFNQARDKIEDKVESAQNASMKVLDLEDMGNALVKNLQSKLERILVVERETVLFEDLIEQTKILQAEMKALLVKLEKRYGCYFSCNPNNPIETTPCFND